MTWWGYPGTNVEGMRGARYWLFILTTKSLCPSVGRKLGVISRCYMEKGEGEDHGSKRDSSPHP